MAEAGIYLLLQRRHWVTGENCGVFSERPLRIKQAPLCVLYLEQFRHHLSTISGADHRKALPRKSFLNIGREKHPTLRSQNTMHPGT